MPTMSNPLQPIASDTTSVWNARLAHFNPHALRSTVQGSMIEHVQLAEGLFDAQIAHSDSGAVQIDWARYNLALMAQGTLAADKVTMGLWLGGTGDWSAFGAPCSNGDLLIVPERSELAVRLPDHAQWVSIQVSRDRLEAAGIDVNRVIRNGGWRLGGNSTELALLLAKWSPQLQHADDPPRSANGATLALAHEELFLACATELANRAERAGCAPLPRLVGAGERWRVIRRVQRYLDECDTPLMRIDELCADTGISLSTLKRAFVEAYGQSPRRYLALRRMAGARSELLAGAPTATVTDVAIKWGFTHLGRFSIEYARLYHERPSDTLARR